MGFWAKFKVGMDGSGNISTKMNGTKKRNVIISLLNVEKIGEKFEDRFRKSYLCKNVERNSEFVINWLKINNKF